MRRSLYDMRNDPISAEYIDALSSLMFECLDTHDTRGYNAFKGEFDRIKTLVNSTIFGKSGNAPLSQWEKLDSIIKGKKPFIQYPKEKSEVKKPMSNDTKNKLDQQKVMKVFERNGWKAAEAKIKELTEETLKPQREKEEARALEEQLQNISDVEPNPKDYDSYAKYEDAATLYMLKKQRKSRR